MSSSSSTDSQSGEGSVSEAIDQTVPIAPVDLWRSQLKEQVLSHKDLIDFFKQATPPLFLLECARDPADLGEWLYTRWIWRAVSVLFLASAYYDVIDR